METLCMLRDVYRSLCEFESKFEQKHGLCFNEGMLLCTLQEQKYSSSEIASLLNLTNSNTSKVIKSVEDKGLIVRLLGEKDKRQMYFSLTEAGMLKLQDIRCNDVELPPLIQKLLAK